MVVYISANRPAGLVVYTSVGIYRCESLHTALGVDGRGNYDT